MSHLLYSKMRLFFKEIETSKYLDFFEVFKCSLGLFAWSISISRNIVHKT